jgi:hypothetical protein
MRRRPGENLSTQDHGVGEPTTNVCEILKDHAGIVRWGLHATLEVGWRSSEVDLVFKTAIDRDTGRLNANRFLSLERGAGKIADISASRTKTGEEGCLVPSGHLAGNINARL